ncbi:Aste57867_18589 [Aphanomyces stellatus]|uniref:Aste57867_18589 protein n=1 Tax=Aphanomyces stellatus TaxID=120398 RepID=A0A485LCC1_9STRA|nr:hypothetical protein As57867_018527 [Aphanomyces stellatus]VFT95324.1 Aste57867_18589 [Aphanomyces stellatus]
MKIGYLLATLVALSGTTNARELNYGATTTTPCPTTPAPPAGYGNNYNDNNYHPTDAPPANAYTTTRAPTTTTTPKPTPAPTRTPRPTPAPGLVEFNRFWNTQAYCDAELALTQCLLDCNVVSDFATSQRVVNCVQYFASLLCNDIPAGGYDNGRVCVGNNEHDHHHHHHVDHHSHDATDAAAVAAAAAIAAQDAKQQCTNDAVVAALYTISEIQAITIGDESTPVNLFLASNRDTFTLLKSTVASYAVTAYGSCATGSLLQFADAYATKRYFGDDVNTCLNSILRTCTNHDLSVQDNLQENNYLPHINQLLTGGNIVVGPDGGDPSPELTLFGELISSAANGGTEAVGTTTVTYTPHGNAPNTATFNVRTDWWSPLNARASDTLAPDDTTELPVVVDAGFQTSHLAIDLPGTPLADLAFHFPAVTYNFGDGTFSPATYGPNTTASQFPEGTLLDPLTPPGGIQDTCERFYTLSLIAYFAGVDTGDYCFTIDGYSVTFLESATTVDLRYTPIPPADGAQCDPSNQDGALGYILSNIETDIDAYNALVGDPTATAAQIAAASTQLALDQATYLSLNSQPWTCPQAYALSWDDVAYCPRHLAQFEMHTRCCRSFASLLATKQNILRHVERGCHDHKYNVKVPAALAGDLEYTATVVSQSQNGELTTDFQNPNAAWPSVGLIDKTFLSWSILAAATTNLTQAQFADFEAALAYLGVPDAALTADFELHYDPNTHQVFGDHTPFQPPPVNVSLYLSQNVYTQALNQSSDVGVDWSSIIPLVPNPDTCYNPSCLLSRYIDCAERPPSDNYHAHNKYIPPYYTSFLETQSTSSNWALLSASGFVGGVLVVALAQVVLQARATGRRDEVSYHHIM